MCLAVWLQGPQPVFCVSVSCTECFAVHGKCVEPLRKSRGTKTLSPLMVMEWTATDDDYLANLSPSYSVAFY